MDHFQVLICSENKSLVSVESRYFKNRLDCSSNDQFSFSSHCSVLLNSFHIAKETKFYIQTSVKNHTELNYLIFQKCPIALCFSFR